MKKVPLYRLKNEFNPTTAERHLHPFSDIGPLRSHIHPHFVMYSTGQKLADIASQKTRAEFNTFLANLAETASLGHEGSPDEVKAANLVSLLNITAIYDEWSSDADVPDEESRKPHPWIKYGKGRKAAAKSKSAPK